MPKQYSYPGAWIAKTSNVYQWIEVREKDSWLIAVNRKPKSSLFTPTWDDSLLEIPLLAMQTFCEFGIYKP